MTTSRLVLTALVLLSLAGCGGDPGAGAAGGVSGGEGAAEAASDAEIAEGMSLEAEIVGRTWALASLEGEAPVEGSASTMTLAEDGGISGLAGCNRYFGTFTLEGDVLDVSPLAATKKACPPELARHEARFLELLEGARYLRLDGSRLTVTSAEGELAFTLDVAELPGADDLSSEPL